MHDSKPTASLSSAFEQELDRVSARAHDLWLRQRDLSPRETAEMYGLWEYEKRLRLLRVLLTIADPRRSVEPDALRALDGAFRDAVVRHGSATDDNLRAASRVTVQVCSDEHTSELSLEIEPSGPSLGALLLGACDVLGTAEFFDKQLRTLPVFARLTAESWEDAYRVLMLTTDALFRCPHYKSEPPTEGRETPHEKDDAV